MRPLRRLVIVGAGDFARELLWYANDIDPVHRDWEVLGFIDDMVDEARARMARSSMGMPVLGSIQDYEPRTEDVFICGIGSPESKLRVCALLQARGAQFTDVIHPSVRIGPGSTHGVGTVLCPLVTVTVNVTLGDFVTVNLHSSLGHDVSVGDGCTISAHCDVTGHSKLGRAVFLGSHSVVLPGARAGDSAVVGAGSVVVHRAPPKRTVFGIPARVFPPESGSRSPKGV